MKNIKLVIPKQVIFTKIGQSKTVRIQNPTPYTIAVKLKVNSRTALQIQPKHDFIDPNSFKEIHIKLTILQKNVKIQYNYTQATQQMINKKDSKLTDVDKTKIHKQIMVINVDNIQKCQQVTTKSQNLDLYLTDSFQSKTIEIDKIEKKTQPITTPPKTLPPQIHPLKQKQSSHLPVLQQHHQQDEQQQLIQKKKKLQQDLQQLQLKIQSKKNNIQLKNEQIIKMSNNQLFIPKITLFALILAAFIIGGIIKNIII